MRSCTNPAPSCGGADCAGSSSQVCNLQSCIVGPWWQVVDGDVQTNGDLNSNVPTGYYFGLDGLGGFPGVAKYGGSTDLTATKVSEKGWLANSSYAPPNGRVQNYAYFRRLVPEETMINEIPNGIPFSLEGTLSADGYYWYEYTGSLPLRIMSDLDLTGKKSFFWWQLPI